MKITMAKAIQAYINLRDKKQEMQKKHKQELSPINQSMEKIEGWLQRKLLNDEEQSSQTANGTAYLSTVTKTSVKDRDALIEFVKETGMYELFENKVAKSVVEDYIESTGDVVPGVSIEKTQLVRVRR